jgi:hypothetical protein
MIDFISQVSRVFLVEWCANWEEDGLNPMSGRKRTKRP